MPASRNSLDQRAISSPADLNFPQLLLQQGAECSGSSGFSFISDCCPSLSPRREKSGLEACRKTGRNSEECEVQQIPEENIVREMRSDSLPAAI